MKVSLVGCLFPIVITVFTDYVFVPTAYNCSSAECECITSAEECRMAANRVIELQYFRVQEQDEPETYPPGCYVYEGEALRFNSNFTADFSLDYNYAMLCREKPDQANYHGKY